MLQLNSGIKADRGGTVFVTSLLVTTFLVTIVAAFIGWVAYEYRASSRSHHLAVAEALAEAGVEKAIWEPNYGGGAWTGWTSTADGSGNTINTRTFSGFQSQSGQTMGDIVVTATISSSQTPIIVESTGYWPNQANATVHRTVKVRVNSSLFSNGISTLGGITLSSNSMTDSYDSVLGAYALQPHTSQGDIATNDDIAANGADINGNATPGPGHTVSGADNVSGSTSAASSLIVLEPVTALVTYHSTHNNNVNIDPQYFNGTGLKLKGSDSLTLPAGDYYFTSIDITGGGQLTVSGAVNIWISSGNIDTHGNGFSNTGASTDLAIYATSTDINFNFTGNAYFNGSIYAPAATIHTAGNATWYGAIACNAITANGNVEFHYDLAQGRKKSPFNDYKVEYWQEK